MKPPAFEYFSPTSLEEALDLTARYADSAKPLAGGQSLVPMLNMGFAFPEQLIDLNRVTGLAYIRRSADAIAIGAMTRQRVVERSADVQDALPLLPAAAREIGHFQTRNRGTIGGSLAHGDPAAELAACLLALDGSVRTESVRTGERLIPSREFFMGPFTTALVPGELLTGVLLPVPPAGTGWSLQEFSRRRGDFALCGICCLVTLRDGIFADVRIAVFGIGGRPLRLERTERLLCGEAPDEEVLEGAVREVRDEVDPTGDVHGSSEYRRHLAGVLIHRALGNAVTSAEASGNH